MIACKAQLDAVINTLRQTSWQGAGPAIAALGPTDLFICDLFNRCEKYWVAYLNRASAGAPAPSPTDPNPLVSGGSPGAPVHKEGE